MSTVQEVAFAFDSSAKNLHAFFDDFKKVAFGILEEC